MQEASIGAGADDLAGGFQVRREIPDDGRIGPYGALFMRDVFAVAPAGEPEIVGEQPDIDAEFVQHVEAALGRSRGDQMLFDRIQFGIDDRAAVEGPDRQHDRERLDQKPHADGRTAGGDGETDAGIVQPPPRGFGAVGQGLVLGQQRAVDI